MATELQLRLQQQQEREILIREQSLERERILTQQQNRLQEQQAECMQLQTAFFQEPTAEKEHAFLMAQRALQHLQEVLQQEQQHVMEKHQYDQLRLQEQQWHQQQQLLQQIQQQQQQQQLQSAAPTVYSPGHGHGHGQGYGHGHGQEQTQRQGHGHGHGSIQGQGFEQNHFGSQGQRHHQHLPNSSHSQYQHQQQNHYHQQQQQQHHHQNQQQQQHYSDSEAMDVDDEATLLSITSTISNLRQTSSRPDASATGAWALGTANTLVTPIEQDDVEAVVVLDTNVLLSHLNFIRSLVAACDTKSAVSRSNVVFIVPWVVIQELDGLKVDRPNRRGGDIDVADKARRAIKRARVTLFSNDRNLCVKAMIHEIATLSYGKIQFEVETVMATIVGQSLSNSPKTPQLPNGSTAMLMESEMNGRDSGALSIKASGVAIVGSSKRTYRTVVNERELERIKASSKVISAPEGMDPRLFELTTHILIRLRRYLEVAVPDHLKAYFGPEWKSRVKFDEKKPKPEDMQWDCRKLAHPIHLLQTFWRPVFSDLYHSVSLANRAKLHLDGIQSFVKSWDRVETFGLGKVYKKDLTVFLEDVDAVLAGVMVKPSCSTSPTDLSPTQVADRDKMYEAQTRIRMVKDWKAHCKALE
ncbi:hypothetical protein BGZ94_002474 [Podila epigama]|nr:hypothetical protein BGZ94_002474 [Podila epigama]